MSSLNATTPGSMMLSLQQQTLDNTIGALVLGVIGASFLFGINVLQIYRFYHYYPRDSLLHKFSVAILGTLDALHLALTIHSVYKYVVGDFGNILGLLHIEWSLKLQVSVNVVVTLIVHSLYAMRVWLLGGYHRGFLGYFVASVVTAGFAIGVVLSYKIYTVHTYPDLDQISWAIYSALATSTTIDFVITSAMCFYLRKSKGEASPLNSRISVIIQYTLSSGLLTSACSLSALFSYILLPNTFVFVALEFLLTKLYVGSFLAMLNARKRTHESDEESSLAQKHSYHHLKPQATSSFWSPVSPTTLNCSNILDTHKTISSDSVTSSG